MRYVVRLSPRDRRALGFGIAVSVVALLAFRVLPAAAAWSEERAESARELSTELASLRLDLTHQRTRKASVAELGSRLQRQRGELLEARNPAAAAAALAAHIALMADSSGLDVQSLQIRSDTIVPGARFTYARVVLNATADVRGLASMLARLERSPPLLVVRSLVIAQPDPGAEMEALRVDMEIGALTRLVTSDVNEASAERQRATELVRTGNDDE